MCGVHTFTFLLFIFFFFNLHNQHIQLHIRPYCITSETIFMGIPSQWGAADAAETSLSGPLGFSDTEEVEYRKALLPF